MPATTMPAIASHTMSSVSTSAANADARSGKRGMPCMSTRLASTMADDDRGGERDDRERGHAALCARHGRIVPAACERMEADDERALERRAVPRLARAG